jgi:hypothetical protein
MEVIYTTFWTKERLPIQVKYIFIEDFEKFLNFSDDTEIYIA